MSQINSLLRTKGKTSKSLRIIVSLATIMGATNVLAVGNNYINPDEGKCNVQLPPNATPAFWSNTDNKIHYTMDIEDGILKATCHMVNSDFDLDNAMQFTGDDYNFAYRCLVKINNVNYYTPNSNATATPSGKVKLTCTVDLNAPT